MKHIILSIIISISLYSCSCEGREKDKTTKIITTTKFTLPKPPAILNTPEQRSEFLTLHYWDNFNFTDTTLIKRADITEQAFVDFINILPTTTPNNIEKGVNTMLSKASANKEMYKHFTDLYEKYLYDPNSPMRDENSYIAVLNHIIASTKVDEANKVRPRYMLDMILKNRIGNPANNFSYTTANGSVGELSNIKATYTLLFFNNPDCHDCQRVKEYISSSPIFNNVKILAIYSDTDLTLWKKTQYPKGWINGYSNSVSDNKLYDLRAIPSLYLLNKDKKVILKDAPIEAIEQYLTQKRIPN